MKPSLHAASRSRVFYLGADQGLLTDLSPLIEPKGLELTAVASPTDLVRLVRRTPPAVLLLDMAQLPGARALEDFVSALFKGISPCPAIICIAGKEPDDQTMERRLAVMRAGARSYVPRPVSAVRLARRVMRMCGLIDAERYRILVMESDQTQAELISSLLASAGMEALVLEDPMQVLEVMQGFRPNLVLMGLEMPSATGTEMTSIIRDQDEFFGIPILFLSAETDLDRQLQVLKAGGDGFIPTPIDSHQLIGSVEQRIRMSRWLQDRLVLVNRREIANGLLPRHVFMAHLDRTVAAGSRDHDGLGLLVIELDEPHQLRDALGLGGAEQLLRRLEARLSDAMTPEESATRLDDFRYALLARRNSKVRLEELARKLCRRLAELGVEESPGDETKAVKTAVSIGIGLFAPPAGDAITLVSRGEKAVAGARRAGGDQLRVWTPVVTPDGTPEAEALLTRLVKTALAQRGLLLLFQPLIPLESGELEVYEAQLRLRTLDGEQIPPADFLPVAKRSGLMPEVDRWVLERALEVLDDRCQQNPRLRLLIHQRLDTLTATDWLPWFRERINGRELSEPFPMIQLQMRDLRKNILKARPVMERLRDYGLQLSVANVGGTVEEVRLLARLGVTMARLSFRTIARTEQGQLVDIIERLREQGVSVVAAGIEDSDALTRVWSRRPDFVQGNYLGLPGSELSFDFGRLSNAF